MTLNGIFGFALVSLARSDLRMLWKHIDDFGTGYSNLGYLHKNDISILNIDISFVRKILESPEDFAIVETIVNISKSLGLAAVAEGVETDEVRAKLLDMGCTFGQGYLWSKPVNEDEFLALLKR